MKDDHLVLEWVPQSDDGNPVPTPSHRRRTPAPGPDLKALPRSVPKAVGVRVGKAVWDGPQKGLAERLFEAMKPCAERKYLPDLQWWVTRELLRRKGKRVGA